MKLLVIAIICIGFFFIYQKTIGSTLLSYEFCVDQTVALKSESIDMTCGVKRVIYEDLLTCVTSIQQENMAGSFLYGPSGTKKQVELLITEHNSACKQSTVDIPKEGLYISI